MTGAHSVTAAAAGVIGGVVIASVTKMPSVILLLIAVGVIAVVFVVLRDRAARAIVVVALVIGVASGVLRFGAVIEGGRQLQLLQRVGEEVRLRGVADVVDEREGNTTVVVDGGDGRVQVTLPAGIEVRDGDELIVQGVLREPKPIDGFDYRAFLRARGIVAQMLYPDFVERRERIGALAAVRALAQRGLERSVPFPEVSMVEAVVLGARGLMTARDIDALNQTGTRHIVAISGMHMTLLFQGLLAAAVWAGLRRYGAAVAALAVLAVFVAFVGSPASAVRAFLFALALEGARITGRSRGSVTRVVLVAAAGMLLVNPMLLRWDAGFQLSFLAVLGMAHFSPTFQGWFRGVRPEPVRSILAFTAGALVTTTPLVAYAFGRVSLVAPLGNAIVVPLLPVIMAGGAAAALVGAVFPVAAPIAGLPLWGVVAFIRWALGVIAAMPLAFISLTPPWMVFAAWEGLAGVWAFRLTRRRALPRWQYESFVYRGDAQTDV